MSQSIILTETISSEGSELKIAINSFMEDKLNEFKKIMKQNVDQIITANLDKFYSKFSTEPESILFDTDGLPWIKIIKSEFEKRKNENRTDIKFQSLLASYTLIIDELEKNRSNCFILTQEKPSGASYGGIITVNRIFFKTGCITILHNTSHQNNVPAIWFIPYTLSTDVLFTIKHFQLNFDSPAPQIEFIEAHPEYYKGNCLQFEQLCKKEHYAIKKQKQNLQDLININIDKIEHYNTLEKQIKEIENEKEKIRDEKIRMEKEKEKLLIAKQKIKSMKTEIETEKQRLSDMKMEVETEKQKIKTEQFNIDEYFDEW